MAQVLGWACNLATQIVPLGKTESFEVCQISADQTAEVNTCYNTTFTPDVGPHLFSCSGQFDGERTDGYCPISIPEQTLGL